MPKNELSRSAAASWKTDPSQFRFVPQRGFYSAMASLLYPSNLEAGEAGDRIIVLFISANKMNMYFTREIHSANRRGKYRELKLTNNCRQLYGTGWIATYQKEKGLFILDDI
jgi:hypothetical protein